MRPDMRGDFEWGRQFLPHMRAIIAEHLILEAPPEEDMRHNTDLMMLRRVLCGLRVG